MSTAVAPRGTAEQNASAPWAATGGLLRLNLRLDRIRILVWTAAVGLGVAGSMATFETTYTTPESLQARANLLANPATVMMTGPAFGLQDYTFGAMVANELSLYLYLAAAIMSILLVVRHTRGEEESGRMEMLRAQRVGRFAPAAAALLTVAIANAAVGAATAAALAGSGLEGASSLAIGAGTALTGLVFAGVAAVAAQLTEHARGAVGMAMAVLAAAFLIRGIGDVINNQGSWLSWFSPLPGPSRRACMWTCAGGRSWCQSWWPPGFCCWLCCWPDSAIWVPDCVRRSPAPLQLRNLCCPRPDWRTGCCAVPSPSGRPRRFCSPRPSARWPTHWKIPLPTSLNSRSGSPWILRT
ncbi:hypothetical protein OL239_02310 [Arthrobacter sp. ATA002]|uniref:hypothetical protein n=1 Tax=Arthrobacter sp. ATA002 TaxID=2991715 RepID=UPI0022A747D8|nr:hypothetical protein [Arthrobacter sp. ATA002]WAP52161.1 hypothetical protein OL239_02310 [Arthrobacter sp. ATA002]